MSRKWFLIALSAFIIFMSCGIQFRLFSLSWPESWNIFPVNLTHSCPTSEEDTQLETAYREILGEHDPSENTVCPAIYAPVFQRVAVDATPTLPPKTSDMWCVQTYGMKVLHPELSQMEKINIQRKNTDSGTWTHADDEEFFSTLTPGTAVYIFIHGNRCDISCAVNETYAMAQAISLNHSTSVRMVTWCWNSQKVSGNLRDEFNTKAYYADMQGFYLENFIRKIGSENPIILVGHSFGARSILCALHLRAGGTFQGRGALDASFLSAGPISAVLIASAVNQECFTHYGCFHSALDAAVRVSLTRNPSDPALHWYPKLWRGPARLNPGALGYTGPILTGISEQNRLKLDVINVNMRSHHFQDFFSYLEVRQALAP